MPRQTGTFDVMLGGNFIHVLSIAMLKVRKAGQQAVVSILRGSKFMLEPSAPSHHPAAVVTVKYCVKEIETTGGRLYQ